VFQFNGALLPADTYKISVVVANECGSVTPTGTVTLDPCDTFCSLTQGFYGNLKGKFQGIPGVDLVQNILLADSPLIVGGTGKDGKTRKITISNSDSDVKGLTDRLPAGGPNDLIPVGNWNIGKTAKSDGYPAESLDKRGLKFRNNMLGQTITLGLNLRLVSDTGSKLTQLNLTAGEISIGLDGACSTLSVPASVATALGKLGNTTVAGLYELASRSLCGAETYGASMGDLHGMAGAINEAFDECKTTGCVK